MVAVIFAPSVRVIDVIKLVFHHQCIGTPVDRFEEWFFHSDSD